MDPSRRVGFPFSEESNPVVHNCVRPGTELPNELVRPSGRATQTPTYQFNCKLLEYIFGSLYYNTHYTSLTDLANIFSGNCPPSDIGAAGISQTQGPFCTVQLFGAGSHQVEGCAAGLLQSISGAGSENVLWKSLNGPRHYSAIRHR